MGTVSNNFLESFKSLNNFFLKLSAKSDQNQKNFFDSTLNNFACFYDKTIELNKDLNGFKKAVKYNKLTGGKYDYGSILYINTLIDKIERLELLLLCFGLSKKDIDRLVSFPVIFLRKVFEKCIEEGKFMDKHLNSICSFILDKAYYMSVLEKIDLMFIEQYEFFIVQIKKKEKDKVIIEGFKKIIQKIKEQCKEKKYDWIFDNIDKKSGPENSWVNKNLDTIYEFLFEQMVKLI
jgi:hypothetical protein